MRELKRVLIGIQARSTSTRLPRKVLAEIGGKSILQHVIDSARGSARYINSRKGTMRLAVDIALLIPKGDEIRTHVRGNIMLIEGSEDDVLSRYVKASKVMKPDYVVRITADCPSLPSAIITKHITGAVMDKADYFSNVDEDCRTAPDGYDCEVMTVKVLEWLDSNAEELSDREHVTTLIRRSPPEWAVIRHLIGWKLEANLKFSIDTADDLAKARAEQEILRKLIEKGREKSGKASIHRF